MPDRLPWPSDGNAAAKRKLQSFPSRGRRHQPEAPAEAAVENTERSLKPHSNAMSPVRPCRARKIGGLAHAQLAEARSEAGAGGQLRQPAITSCFLRGGDVVSVVFMRG